MGNQPLSGDLPDHLQGRGNSPGPMTGGYVVFTIGPYAVTNAANDTIIGGFKVPFDCRVMAFGWSATAATADADLMLTQNTSLAVGGTNLLSAAIAQDTTASGVAKGSGTTPTLTTTGANRNVDAGNFIILEIDGAGTADITAGVYYVVVAVRGHVNALSSSD